MVRRSSKRARSVDTTDTPQQQQLLVRLKIAPHHKHLETSWPAVTDAASMTLVLTSRSVVGGVEIASGAFRNTALALPGEGIVFPTVLVTALKSTPPNTSP